MAQNPKTSHTVTLTDNSNGKSYELPVLEGNIGPSVIDIRKLYADTGYFTYDPGFTSTGSCESTITYIDGDKGILRHRGYAIDDLAEKADFLEVCYLLIYGDLPNKLTLPCTPWCMSKCATSITVFAAMPTRWPSCAVLLAQCLLFIMTAPILMIRISV